MSLSPSFKFVAKGDGTASKVLEDAMERFRVLLSDSAMGGAAWTDLDQLARCTVDVPASASLLLSSTTNESYTLTIANSTSCTIVAPSVFGEPEAAAAPPCSTLHRWNPRGIRTGTSVQICMATEVVRATRVFMRLLSTTTALHERQLLSLEWKRGRTKCLTMQVAVPLNIHSEKNHLKSQAERCFWLLRDVGGGKKRYEWMNEMRNDLSLLNILC